MSKDALSQFAAHFKNCWLCGTPRDLQIHHICGRRGKRPHDRRNLFRICGHCHGLYHDGSKTERYIDMSHILYCKMRYDSEFYDPAFLASLRGRKHLGYDPVCPDWLDYRVAFTVDQQAVPQPRARITRRGPPRAYVPGDHPVHAFRSRVAEAAARLGAFPTERPVHLIVTAAFKRPASHYRNGLVKDGSPVVPKSDVDNIAKSVMDALTGVAYRDDKLVSKLVVDKLYVRDRAFTNVTVLHAI